VTLALKTSASRSYTHLIGGAWTAGEGGTIDRFSPSSGLLTGTCASATVEDTDRAVAVARQAFDRGEWSSRPAPERGRILLKWAELLRANQETLAQIEAAEVGKPIRMARGDIQGAADLTEYAGALALDIHGEAYDHINGDDLGVVLREPIGVVAAIVPWNFPALIYSQKVPFALAAGCAVVVKPTEMTPSTAFEMSKLAFEAGVPGEVLNVITGEGSIVGGRLAVHHDVDMVSFTGSTAIGRQIAAAPSANHKRLSFELGGKGATIVFDDANLEDALDGVLFGVFLNQGETCCAGSRLLVQDAIADEFLQRLSERASRLKVGDVFADSTDIGAMINARHMAKVLEYIDGGLQGGATLLTGGSRVNVPGHEGGFFVAPTILDHVKPTLKIFQEEIFGPVLVVTRFSTIEDAIRLANDTVYGLGNGVWTKNVDRAIRLGRALRSGTVWVNTANDGAPQLPFGGYKESGTGREKGRGGLDEFLVSKTFHIHVGDRIPYFRAATVRSRRTQRDD